jgi:hypothetical protein
MSTISQVSECVVEQSIDPSKITPSTADIGGPNIQPIGTIAPNDGVANTWNYLRNYVEEDPLQANPQVLPAFRMPPDLAALIAAIPGAIADRLNCVEMALTLDYDFLPGGTTASCQLDYSTPLTAQRRNELQMMRDMLSPTPSTTIQSANGNPFLDNAGYPQRDQLQNNIYIMFETLSQMHDLTTLEGLANRLFGPTDGGATAQYIIAYLNRTANNSGGGSFFDNPGSIGGFNATDVWSIINIHTGAHIGAAGSLLPMLGGATGLYQKMQQLDPCGMLTGTMGSLLGGLDKLLQSLMVALGDLLAPLAMLLMGLIAPLLLILNEILKLLRMVLDMASHALAYALNFMNPCFVAHKVMEAIGVPSLNDVLNSDRLPDRSLMEQQILEASQNTFD